jgi:hypothetical protein
VLKDVFFIFEYFCGDQAKHEKSWACTFFKQSMKKVGHALFSSKA